MSCARGGGGYVDMIRYWAGYSTRGVVTMSGLVNAVNTTRDLKGAAGGQTVTLWSRKFRQALDQSRANVADVGPPWSNVGPVLLIQIILSADISVHVCTLKIAKAYLPRLNVHHLRKMNCNDWGRLVT